MSKVVAKSGRGSKPASRASVCGDDRGALPGQGASRGVVPADPVGAAQRRCGMIAEAAYFRALERNFAPGLELDDWLQAEKDIEVILAGSSSH